MVTVRTQQTALAEIGVLERGVEVVLGWGWAASAATVKAAAEVVVAAMVQARDLAQVSGEGTEGGAIAKARAEVVSGAEALAVTVPERVSAAVEAMTKTVARSAAETESAQA